MNRINSDNFIHVSSLDIPELEVYKIRNEVQLLRMYEPNPGLFICESAKVIRRALDAGYEPVSILTSIDEPDEETKRIYEDCSDIPIYFGDDSILRELAGYALTGGILAVMKRTELPNIEELIKTKSFENPAKADSLSRTETLTKAIGFEDHAKADSLSRTKALTKTKGYEKSAIADSLSKTLDKRKPSIIAVLENVQNPTNVGAIFRSAAAMNVDAVILTHDCSDPLYRRAVRVSMGTVFQIPWTKLEKGTDWILRNFFGEWDYLKILSDLGFKTVAMALSDNAITINDPQIKSEDKLAVILGNEGYGLSDDTIRHSDYVAMIPMNPIVDSLNVAAASAVMFWELSQK